MFSKTNDQAPALGAAPAGYTKSKSVLASDLQITGDIRSTSMIEISGRVEGNVIAKSLMIGAEGQVTGSIAADHVDVSGKFDGTIATQGLVLRSSCDVKAQMRYATLSIETGALIDGTFTVNKA